MDVTPSSANLSVGQQKQFSATGYDAGGNEVPVTPAWTTTGGAISSGRLYTTISSTGTQQILYTAGNLPGRYPITAAQGQVEGHAWVTILGASPPDLAPGQSYEHTFTFAGHYPYYDRHNTGLRGIVVVNPTLASSLSGLDATAVVSITAEGFVPFTVTISISDTVRWTNTDTITHAINGGEPYRVYLPLVVRH